MGANETTGVDTATVMQAMGKSARAASRELLTASTEAKQTALRAAASAMRASILQSSSTRTRVTSQPPAPPTGPASFIDRLMLDASRVEAIAKSLEEIALLPDPVGAKIAEWTRPNGLKFARVRVPLGVIGIIFESRPNVTADAGALALMAGNASILRAGLGKPSFVGRDPRLL